MILVVGISGGSGVIYGIRLLEVLREAKIETHLIMTPAAKETIALETNYKVRDIEALASKHHRSGDIASGPASGSFMTDGMVIMPCSMKTLAGVASGYADNLLLRAADTTLKERRLLVLVPRETPLNIIHLENMLRVARAGGVILPAMPGFYQHPKTMDDLINHVVGKVLDLFKIEHSLYQRWNGPRSAR